MKHLILTLCSLLAISAVQAAESQVSDAAGRWSSDKANQWYAAQPWPCGFNYVPAHAISYTEMWMPYNFDVAKMDKELALAEDAGFNCLRVVLPFVVWEHDPAAFKQRLGEFLAVCDRRGLRVMFALFDDCAFGSDDALRNPRYGKQPDLLEGFYANGWTPSPGHDMVRDPGTWPRLEKYVKDILSTFRDDRRVWVWDLYNEPTNGGTDAAALPLAEKVFEWAREINPTQPLTLGTWNGNAKLNDIIFRHSDIITFHNYSKAEHLREAIGALKKHGRPVINTEWLNRPTGSLVETCLPVFAAENVGCMHWGLVNGRTQTHLAWGARPGEPAPERWQHDLFHADHTPYAPAEIDFFKKTISASRTSGAYAITPTDLRCECRVEPLGIDVKKPRLSWILDSGQQSAYQIVVGGVWDSGKVASDQSVAVAYAGPELVSQKRYDWRVRVWDKHGVAGDWSPQARFVTGLLGEPWGGKWIVGESGANTAKGIGDHDFGSTPDALPVFKRDLVLDKKVSEAVLSICGLGHYELFLNGTKVGDDLLAPGWSNYRKTCLYDTFDLTEQLRNGKNELRVMLGNGFYNVTGGRYVKLRGSFGQPMLNLQMRIRFSDGTGQTVLSDNSWKTASGPITFSCVFGGEDYDARLEKRLDDDSSWTPATLTGGPGGALTGLSQAAAPIGVIETLKAVKVNKISPNLLIHDFGQNVSFMPRLTVNGVAGASVKMIPSELLAGDGRIHDPVCGANSFYTYTLKGDSTGETWFPRFFYRGGRYLQVELSAPDGKPLPEITALESVVVHSKAKPVGDFACSNDLFNRIRTLIRWAQRSNLMSVITDCPHREKLGWLEQYHLHGYALRHEWDMASIYVKGMADMAQAQLENGLVPDIAPEYTVFKDGFRDSPEWGSSFVIVPWQQYEYTGDTSLLAAYFDGMKRYCDYLQSKSRDLIVSHGLGDWYDIGPKPPGVAQLTPRELTATAYFFRCADIVSRAATLLGRTEDARQYGELAGRIREAFNKKFWNEEAGIFSTGSQCANAVPLVMGIAEPRMRERALDAIVKDVEAKGLTAGDVGFHYLLRALYEGGRSDVIYAMTNQSDNPGYGYQLKKGATALTEAWNAQTGSSHNHFMLGHITEWFYAGLAGIQPDPTAPGWKKFIIKPAVVGDLTWVKAHYDSPYGRIVSHWKRDGREVTMDVTVPANSSATVITPDGKPHEAGPGNHQFRALLP